jgi:hypothetical protein
VTGWPLQAPDCPFPVQPLPRPLRPDLLKLGEQPLLIQDTEWADWVLQKHRELTTGAFQVLVSSELPHDSLARLADLVASAFRSRAPGGPIAAGWELPWLQGQALGLESTRPLPDQAGLKTVKATHVQSGGAAERVPFAAHSAADLWLGLTLSLQEDFALMVPDQAGVLRARVLSVCFPSGWQPEEKLNQSFSELHAPVADNQDLMTAAPALSQAMCAKGPFIRHVWTLSGNAARARLPGVDTLAQAESVNDLWFRCERQVTVPLAGQASLFLIRVFICPLRQVVHSAQRWVTLRETLAALSPEMIAYKGLGRAIHLIMNDTSFEQFLLQESR